MALGADVDVRDIASQASLGNLAGHAHVGGGVEGVEWRANLASSNSDVGGIHAAGNGDAARGVAGVEDESFVADGADSWISFRTVPAVEDVAVVAAAVA